jgi:hypothetical protein
MLGTEGIFISQGDRIIGREVRLLSEADIAMHGTAQAIRQKLFALEKKHNISGKITANSTGTPKTSVK